MRYVDLIDNEYILSIDEMEFLLGKLKCKQFKPIPPVEGVKESLIEKGLIIEDEEENYEVNFTDKGLKFTNNFFGRLYYFPNRSTVSKCYRKFIKKKYMTKSVFSRKTGINQSRLRNFEYNQGYVYIDDIKVICEKFSLDFVKVLKVMKKYEVSNKRREQKRKHEEEVKRSLKNVRKQMEIENPDNEDFKRLNRSEDNCIKSNDFLYFKNKMLKIESPIEYKLIKEIININIENILDIDTQVKYSINGRNYRAEIILTYINKLNNLNKMLIECDGHVYHSTKEQMQKDKQRDRDFLGIGIPTIRFTGSEIHKDAKECAEEVFNTCKGYAESVC